MKGQVYKKEGKRYIQLGYSDGFTGFPCDGIWAVYTKPGCRSQSCIAQVGNFIPVDYTKLASLIKEKETHCLQAVMSLCDKGNWTYRDIVDTIFNTLLRND